MQDWTASYSQITSELLKNGNFPPPGSPQAKLLYDWLAKHPMPTYYGGLGSKVLGGLQTLYNGTFGLAVDVTTLCVQNPANIAVIASAIGNSVMNSLENIGKGFYDGALTVSDLAQSALQTVSLLTPFIGKPNWVYTFQPSSSLFKGLIEADQNGTFDQFVIDAALNAMTLGTKGMAGSLYQGFKTGDFSQFEQQAGGAAFWTMFAIGGKGVYNAIKGPKGPISPGTSYVPDPIMENIGHGYGMAAEAPFSGPTVASPLDGLYGPFWRSESAMGAAAIGQSGMLSGTPPRGFFNSNIPTVQAYPYPLPEGATGIQFYTPIPPENVPVFGGQAWWRGIPNTDLHSIPVIVTRNIAPR